jgi:hypothetical protein
MSRKPGVSIWLKAKPSKDAQTSMPWSLRFSETAYSVSLKITRWKVELRTLPSPGVPICFHVTPSSDRQMSPPALRLPEKTEPDSLATVLR